MGLFDDILKAIGLKKGDDKGAPKYGPTERPKGSVGAGEPGGVKRKDQMEMVDVTAKLDAMAKSNPQKLEWRVSIVDLMKLVGIDSSHENRVALAKELGAPADVMGGDSAAMNMWLHKQVMRQISHNGGNVPANLLD
jgi:hypothetical protein